MRTISRQTTKNMQQSDFEQNAPHWRQLAKTASLSYGATSVEADDVAQDVLLKLWLMRDEMKHYRSAEALVTVMARNLTIDIHRKKRVTAIGSEHLSQVDEADDPAQRLIGAEQETRLMKLVNNLPSRQHAVLMMRQIEHRSYTEIASILGIEETSAKTLLSRARKTLLKQFMDEM